MKFSSDYQPKDRPTRGKAQRTLMLEALRRRGMTEEEFWDKVLTIAMTDGDLSQRQMLQEVMLRLAPLPKSVDPVYEFDWMGAESPADKIDRLVNAVADGEIPADIASRVAATIKAGIEVREVTELAERLERLEKLLQEQMRSDG